MKIKDYLKQHKNDVTNITKENLNPNEINWYIGDQDISYPNIAKGKGYIFYVYDLASVDDKNGMIILTGHEETIIYNKKTKKYTSVYTR